MKSFLEPLTSEIYERTRVSQKIRLRLQEKLDSGATKESCPVVYGDIDENWKYSIVVAKNAPNDEEYPEIRTERGIELTDPLVLTLFVRADHSTTGTPLEQVDIDVAASIYVSDNGTVIATGSPGESDVDQPDGNRKYYTSGQELNSDELEGLLNDIESLA